MAVVACFPNELYRGIARHLHQRRDKGTLLSLSLVNQVWRHESQRVLFSSLSNDWYIGPKFGATHILFLEAIIAQPTRLGSYVYLYGQTDLAVNRETIESDEVDFYREGLEIWELTSCALPAMINLKHLFLSPAVGGDMAYYFLDGCKFQLDTLTWKCEEEEKSHLINFLITQRTLAHFDMGEYVEEEDMSWLPRNACPDLISTSCNMDSMSILQRRRGVTALKSNMPTNIEQLHRIQDQLPDVLERIKYLSMWNYPSSSPLIWPIAPNVSLLEIQIWDLDTLRSLSVVTFPNLRVLALLDGDHILQDINLLVQVPDLTLHRLKKLEAVFIRPLNSGLPLGFHLKMSHNRTAPDAKVEISWVLGDCRLGLRWWEIYDM